MATRSNCSAFYLYRATCVASSSSPSLCACVGIEGCGSCMAFFVPCTSILTHTLIPSTCTAYQVRSVYAISINMILLSVFRCFWISLGVGMQYDKENQSVKTLEFREWDTERMRGEHNKPQKSPAVGIILDTGELLGSQWALISALLTNLLLLSSP